MTVVEAMKLVEGGAIVRRRAWADGPYGDTADLKRFTGHCTPRDPSGILLYRVHDGNRPGTADWRTWRLTFEDLLADDWELAPEQNAWA